jgi:hypothetical protein
VAITTLDGLIAASRQQVRIIKTASATTVAALPFTTLDLAGYPGAGSLAVGNTANGLVPTDATAGFPLINAFGGSATGYLQAVDFGNSVAGRLTLYDRLFHAGSYSLTALATVNLTAQPSYSGRVPSGTDFTNTELFLEINTAVAASAVSVTVTYTNESGVAARTTGASVSLASMTTRRLVPMPLQAGDSGVQKIESVTVGGTVAATGTANVVVARRLWSNRARVANDGGLDAFDATGLPVVFADSALWLVCEADSTSSGVPEVVATIVNG